MAGLKVRKLGTDGDIAIPAEWIDGNEATAQLVSARLRIFRGEWFADANVGIPYFQQILGQKDPDLSVLEGLFKLAIFQTPGISSVDYVSCALDGRLLTVEWSAVASDGYTKIQDSESVLV